MQSDLVSPLEARRRFRRLRDWICLEGSLSQLLPPGLGLPGEPATELLQALREAGRR